MIINKIGQRGQVTLPKEIRKVLGLGVGDHVIFIRRGDDILLQPLKQTLLDLRGSVPVQGPQDFDAIRQQVKQAISERATDHAD